MKIYNHWFFIEGEMDGRQIFTLNASEDGLDHPLDQYPVDVFGSVEDLSSFLMEQGIEVIYFTDLNGDTFAFTFLTPRWGEHWIVKRGTHYSTEVYLSPSGSFSSSNPRAFNSFEKALTCLLKARDDFN